MRPHGEVQEYLALCLAEELELDLVKGHWGFKLGKWPDEIHIVEVRGSRGLLQAAQGPGTALPCSFLSPHPTVW